MGCLHRLANWDALKLYLATSNKQNFDKHTGSITYSHGGKSVTYKRKNSNWAPITNNTKKVLVNFGFDQVQFIPSRGDRFFVQEADVFGRDLLEVEENIKDRMNEMFASNKYSDLKKIRINPSQKRGANSRSNNAFVLPAGVHNGTQMFFSEKNFSMGEVLILNLLLALQKLKNRSLLLIDEVELALHPRVQVELYRYLEQVSKNRNITVLISTHSSSLIKASKSLILLDKQSNGVVNVEKDCSPAKALGALAYDEDVVPDAVFYVEDKHAKILLHEMLQFYWQKKPNKPPKDIRLVYIGGYKQVLEFLDQANGYLFHNNLPTRAFLDLDVKDEAIPSLKPTDTFMLTYTRLSPRVDFLPCTPEVGLCEYVQNNISSCDTELGAKLGRAGINLGSIIGSSGYRHQLSEAARVDGEISAAKTAFDIETNLAEKAKRESEWKQAKLSGASTKRTLAKNKLKMIVDYLENVTNRNRDDILRTLFSIYVRNHYAVEANFNLMQASFGQALN